MSSTKRPTTSVLGNAKRPRRNAQQSTDPIPSTSAIPDSQPSTSLSRPSASASSRPGPRSGFALASGSSKPKKISRVTTLLPSSKDPRSRSHQRVSVQTGDSSTIGVESNQSGVNTSGELEAETLGDCTPPIPESDFSAKSAGKKRVRTYENWTVLVQWLPRRQQFLDELLRLDGLGDSLDDAERCADCKVAIDGQSFRCSDCFDRSSLQCKQCVVSRHTHLPLHRIQRWNSCFFEGCSLRELGLRVQLGHGGGPCTFPVPGPSAFTVFDTEQYHQVRIDFCGCQTLDRSIQLFRTGWFPATLDQPHTAYTFNLLDTFHVLSLQSKTTLYDFYHSIIRRTDALRLHPIPSRLNDLHRVVRFWRCLMMLKRAGRGHDLGGVDATRQGELAVECPACPHPEKNLPDNWRSFPPSELFIFSIFLAIDANFKLKGKNRGIKDVEMTPGWAYFVEENAYQEHLVKHVDESEINTCQSEHDALVRAAVRCTPGYDVTGVGAVVCSRHGLIRPNGLGDLQKGERYCNIDYIFLCAVASLVTLLRIVVTYDIACQWSKNWTKRNANMPEGIQLPSTVQLDTAVPSWHINAHGPDCQANFALAYQDGNACTCGEEVEGTWEHTNPLGTSVREMGRGAAHDVIIDHSGGLIGMVKGF